MYTYRNPVIYADYSDPDAIRVGKDYFLVASSFCNTPGLPILHSTDLVHWELINYALENIPFARYRTPQHGCGVWAPAIRYHEGVYYILFPMPDEGIFMTKTTDPWGEWSEPVAIFSGKGWIDPCPFWDEDGRVYMVNAFAKSRIGFKSVLQVVELNKDCSAMIGEPVKVFDGNTNDQVTIEGPKLYRRGGYYYIFAPAGGVKQGWQTVLRSKNIYGPYAYRKVCEQGDTAINGPHQGAWVDTASGEDWFLHFQDIYATGRIVHLQPMRWTKDAWPVIGEAKAGEICGAPVTEYRLPDTDAGTDADEGRRKSADDRYTANADRKNPRILLSGADLQWNANHEEDWAVADEKTRTVTLRAVRVAESLADQPNLLLQKWVGRDFVREYRMEVAAMRKGDEAGLMHMGVAYGALSLVRGNKGFELTVITGEQSFANEKASSTDSRRVLAVLPETLSALELRYAVQPCEPTEKNTDGLYAFPIPREEVAVSYRIDGGEYTEALRFVAKAGRWVGAKYGFYLSTYEPSSTGTVSIRRIHEKEEQTAK